MTVKGQLIAVLRSRKFWALLLSIAGTAVAYSYGKIDAQTAILAGIGAAGAYMVGTGLEGPATPPLTSLVDSAQDNRPRSLQPTPPTPDELERLARLAATEKMAG